MSTLLRQLGSELSSLVELYESETIDPGAVGAGQYWLQRSTKTLFRRDATNTFWIVVLTQVGGVDPNSIVLDPGSTWTDVLQAYADVPAGGTIYLPDEVIIQTSNLWIQKSVKIRGSGPLSTLKLLDDVSVGGAAEQIRISYPSTSPGVFVDGVELANFTIEHDRTNTTRTLGIVICQQARNVYCTGLHFENMTSDCFCSRDFSAPNSGNEADGIYIVNCTANNWWESFLEHIVGSVKNLYIINNHGVTSNASPNSQVSRPSGIFINLENPARPGLVDGCYIIGNTFDANLTGAALPNSIGMAVRQNGGTDHRYHHLHVHRNTFDGWDYGLNHFNTQKSGGSPLFPGSAHHYITNNTWRNCGRVGLPGICDLATWGMTGDHVFFTDNDIYKKVGGQVAVRVAPGGPTPPTIVTTPANRVHEPSA